MEASLIQMLTLMDASVSREEKQQNPKLKYLMRDMKELAMGIDFGRLKKLQKRIKSYGKKITGKR